MSYRFIVLKYLRTTYCTENFICLYFEKIINIYLKVNNTNLDHPLEKV